MEMMNLRNRVIPLVVISLSFVTSNALSGSNKNTNPVINPVVRNYVSANQSESSEKSTLTGFVKKNGEWLYYENGKKNPNRKDIVKGTVNGQTGWWYISSGKVQFVNTVVKNKNGWWAIQKGRVNFNFTGFAKNENGWWYCNGGKVDFNKNDVIKGTVNGETAWWYVKGGKVQFINTIARNRNGWWCIEDGKVNFNHNGIVKNENGWWKCKGGKVDFTYNGVAKNKYGWWYCHNGKVNFSYNGFEKNQNGTWYCRNGNVTFKDNGYYIKDNKTYIVKGSKLSKVTSEPQTLTKLNGYYVSPMYAGNLNNSKERIEAMIKRSYDYLNAVTGYEICKSEKPGEKADCSGLVMQCLYAAGFDPYPATPAHHALPENEYDSRTLWNDVKMKHINVTKDGSKYATEENIDMTKLHRGDLIFYKSEEWDIINHIAIYLGNGQVIEAVRPWVVDYLGLFNTDVHNIIYGVARPFE